MPSTGGSRVELPKTKLIARSDRPCVHAQLGAGLSGSILSIIAEHVRQNLGVEDAARRRDEITPDG